MNKSINGVLLSIFVILATAGISSAEYYTRTLNLGGDPIQYSQPIITPFFQTYTPAENERRTYTGSIIQTTTQQPTKVYVPVYQPNYINTYSVTPYYGNSYYPSRTYTQYYPIRNINTNYNEYSGIGINSSINTGSFAYNYTGHGFDYGFSSGRPLYTNRAMTPPPPPPPPQQRNNTMKPINEFFRR